MSTIVKDTQKELRIRITEALGRAVADGELPAEPIPGFNIERPANSKGVQMRPAKDSGMHCEEHRP